MKIKVLSTYLLPIVAILGFGFAQAKPIYTFDSVAMKKFTGMPGFMFIKKAAEIPEFTYGTPEEKKQWNRFAAQANKIAEEFMAERKKFKALPEAVQDKKLGAQLKLKRKELDEGIEKIVNKREFDNYLIQ